jgi:hypothetical protein
MQHFGSVRGPPPPVRICPARMGEQFDEEVVAPFVVVTMLMVRSASKAG